jgi:predicted metal-dependent enzyme (double-stranded beta helix superfamily)
VSDLAPLRRFVADLSALLDRTGEEARILAEGRALLAELIARDDWLPDTHAAPNPERYTQYLLHRDPATRFSVVSFVWGPGQSTPVHDHTVWGLVGVLRGAEVAESYVRDGGVLRVTGTERLEQGAIDAVSPTIGDLHKVSNGLADRPSISIHVYGADIGAVRRATYDAAGQARPFVSGYSDAPALAL